MAQFIKPVQFPYSEKFGERIDPLDKSKKQFHNGVDFAAPYGSKVYAPADGIIVTGNSEAGGLQLFIVHRDGYVSGFAHLSKLIAGKGDTVKQGQLIALTGNSGAHTTGAHLHYTLKKNNQYINPINLFA